MTAICGIVDFTGRGDLGPVCRAMLNALAPYGENSSEMMIAPGAAFGVRSSSRERDYLDRGTRSPGGPLIAGDVRLDNRAELSARLERAQPGPSDESVVAALLRAEGSGALERVVGDFALASWDSASRQLTLARDTTGQRPLFMARRDSRILFASMPIGLLAVPGLWRGFDRYTLARIIADVRPEPQATSYVGVHRVLPGHRVMLTAENQIEKPLWEPDFTPLQLRNSNEYIDAYREQIDRAVGSRIERRVSAVAAHLSSGLDSSAVAATAAQLVGAQERLIALTAAPPLGFDARTAPRGRMHDESELASLTAGQHAMKHIIVRSSGSLVKRMRRQARLYQDPYRNHINTGWMFELSAAAARSGASRILSGELGNLTLNAGGLAVLSDMRKQSLWRWLEEAHAVKREQDVRWRGILFSSFGEALPTRIQQGLLARFQDAGRKDGMSFLRPDLASSTNLMEQAHQTSGYTALERWQVIRSLDYGNLRLGSLAETGLETLDPTADRRVIGFSLRLPTDQLLRHGVSRPLAKAALADRVPAEVLHSRLRGYQSADWLEQLDAGEIKHAIEEIAANATACELIDMAALRKAVDRWPVADDDRLATYEQFAIHLLLAVAVGLFIVEFDRPIAGRH